MRACELLELLEELCDHDPDMEVNIAYQPHYPLAAPVSHLKVRGGEAYICESGYGGNCYAPGHLFDDNESSMEDYYGEDEE